MTSNATRPPEVSIGLRAVSPSTSAMVVAEPVRTSNTLSMVLPAVASVNSTRSVPMVSAKRVTEVLAPSSTVAVVLAS